MCTLTVYSGEEYLSIIDKKKRKRFRSLSNVPIIGSYLFVNTESVRVALTLEESKLLGIVRIKDFTTCHASNKLSSSVLVPVVGASLCYTIALITSDFLQMSLQD